ncbi:transmembrane protein 248 [Salarias fasciatus]|uniref:Transmembrane protein 248-like n=1 Tax=Salarias fasciatus TaxID=181472 RepID=A0A672F4A2_SALFA|nr:transmembrane protein 248-like [Salarias fasciatus]XP_029960718.1 transmembrane protein 248-like [Salarias fasciatus]
MMGLWQPVTNLRDYVSHNPPAFTFFLGLLTLAMSFICLGSYSHTHTLPNPDTSKDWNHLLSSLSQFQLCEKANESSPELNSSVPSSLMEQEKDEKASVNVTKRPSSILTLHLRVPLTVTIKPPSDSPKDLHLHTTLRASLLNIGGEENVTLTLEVLAGNSTRTCLTISAPAHLLPMSLRPPECPASEKNISQIHAEASEQLLTESQACYSLHFKNDPTLTVMLTQEEQSMAVRHLFEVGIFLLVICVLLCLTVSLTHSLTRRQEWKGLDLQNEPLIDS